MPSGMAQTRLANISSTVGPMVLPSSVVTGMLLMIDTPRSPCSNRAKYNPNCTGSGRSRPRSARKASTTSCVAIGPARTTAGSVGTTCISRKPTIKTPSSTGTASMILRAA